MSSDNSQFAWQVHGYLNEYIKFADTKAALLAGLAGPLTIGIFSFNNWILAVDFKSLFSVTSALFFGFAFCCAFMSVWPNLFTSNLKRAKKGMPKIESLEQSEPDKGFIYWENIFAHSNANTFARELVQLSGDDQLQHVGKHCYELAKINRRKFKLVLYASRLFAAGLLSLAVFVSIHLYQVNSKQMPNGSQDNSKTHAVQQTTLVNSTTSETSF